MRPITITHHLYLHYGFCIGDGHVCSWADTWHDNTNLLFFYMGSPPVHYGLIFIILCLLYAVSSFPKQTVTDGIMQSE